MNYKRLFNRSLCTRMHKQHPIYFMIADLYIIFLISCEFSCQLLVMAFVAGRFGARSKFETHSQIRHECFLFSKKGTT